MSFRKTKTTKKRPPENGKKFSKDYQPSGENKSKGKAKSRLLKDLLEMAFVGAKGAKLRKAAAAYMNLPEETITLEDMMHYRQIEKAISKSNTFAYQAVLDRAYGKPVQPIEDESPKKIIVTIKKNAS
jgi:ribosomal 50S subunit-associated protein YjgA (DUF615 family)